jgi:hypothetical protein
MESLHLFLLVLILFLLGIVLYMTLNPVFTMMSYPVMPQPWPRPHINPQPHPVMPHYGPYWQHGGQDNSSGLLF